MVLAQAEDVESHLIGQFDLLDKVAQPGFGGYSRPRYPARTGIAEGIETDFHVHFSLCVAQSPRATFRGAIAFCQLSRASSRSIQAATAGRVSSEIAA